MVRYPIDETGRLIAIVVDGPLPDGTAGEADGPPADGNMIWNAVAGRWRWPDELARAKRQADIDARFRAALEAGMAYQGKVLQIREADQQNIAAVGQEARWAKLAGSGWPANFAWRMAGNDYLPLPLPDDMIALGEAAKAEVFRLRLVKWAHADAVAALVDPEATAAYDIETGW